MNKEKLIKQLFAGKVADILGLEKTQELLKEATDEINEMQSQGELGNELQNNQEATDFEFFKLMGGDRCAECDQMQKCAITGCQNKKKIINDSTN